MIKACLSLLAGAYALHFTSFATTSGLIVIAMVGAGVLLRVGGRNSAALFLAGLILFAWQSTVVLESRLQAGFEGDSMLAVVRIIDFPRMRGGSASFLAEPVDDRRIPRRIRLSWYQPPEAPEIGDLWKFELRLKPPRGTSNPGIFDYETWLFQQRIGASGYIVNGRRNQLLQTDAAGGLARFRKRFTARLTKVIDDGEAVAVIAAVTVGARHLISDEQWTRYARSGTSHLMAISGLHVGLAATATYVVVLLGSVLVCWPGNHVRIALCASLIVAAAYSMLSGFAVPAQRSTLMLCLLVLVLLRAREPGPFAILAAACMLVVAGNPLSTLTAGFKLSFSAVFLLLWLARRRNPGRSRSAVARMTLVAAQLATMQLFLLSGLMPFTVSIFHRIAVVAPAVNFAAVPIFSFVTVPSALAGVILDGPFAVAGDAALRIAALSVQLIDDLIDLSLRFPYSDISTANITGAGWLVLGLVLAWVLFPPGWPGRHVAWLAAYAIASYRVDGPPDDCFDTTMLDVGQGLAVVVRTREKILLYDTGAAWPGGVSMAERVVLPYLSGQGIDRIDRVVISHADVDHAGGLGDLLAGIAVGDVLAGEALDTWTAKARRCRRGNDWDWNGVEFRVLHPVPGEAPAGNNASCVLVIEAGAARLLITGDIEAGVERSLLLGDTIAGSDVVVVPHHGSRTSSSRSFVATAAPDLALISAGYGNRWGLPRPDVVRRWRDAGAEVLTTAVEGAISLRLCDGAGIVDLDRHRNHIRRVWHEARVD
jgi:competence protein ComEC